MSGKQITMGLVAGLALTIGIVLNHRPITSIPTAPQSQQASSSSQYLVHKLSIGTSGNRVAPKSNDAMTKNVKQPAPPASAATTQNAQETVSIKLVDPDGTSSFEVKLDPGDDLCANLVAAKAGGKIRSLTVDDSYLSTFHSRYIREINSYSNNWTVKVNGTAPEGCSLYKPKPGDSIVWKFGE